MRFDLNAFVVFATVVEAGGFTAAADRLGISKSAVSKQVSALEDRLGTRLLNRTTRKLSTTEAGLAVYERAARIVSEAADAETVVGDLASAPRGRLRINSAHSFAVRYLPTALRDFHRCYPEVEIDLVLNDRIVDLVDEGFDVAIRIGRLRDSSLIARKLIPVELHLVASPGYLDAAGSPETVHALEDHRCLAYSLQDRPGEWRLTDPQGTTHVVRTKPFLTANNGDVIEGLVECGSGIALLPDFICGRGLQDGRLVRVLPDHRVEPIAVHAIYPAVRHLASKVRVFVDFLAAWCLEHNRAGETAFR